MKRVLLCFLGFVVFASAATLYVAHARGDHLDHADDEVEVVTDQPLSIGPDTLSFRNVAEGKHLGRIAAVPVGNPAAARRVGELSCDRFATAAGTSVCLTAKPGAFPPVTELRVLGPDLAVRARKSLPGTPSRARVSPDGKLVMWTLFVSGDSYAASGFSTRTGLYEVATAKLVKSIEELTVFVDGRRYHAADLNYWGLSFGADGNLFYVTLSSKGKTYLVEGDLRGYTGKAIAPNVECPSLSPDGTRVAYKHKNPDGSWRLSVLNLATRRSIHLAETRGIDDQPLWRDNRTVLYGLQPSGEPPSIWSVAADGTGSPALLVRHATSPAIG